ncbi:IQ motif [Macleaya cordata]|uniref:IQ motif n=1 Tax=Macleaya cordata TaxID=56857 RepID=A0A200PMA7_MACCD|nr:IQ motif [Macleaya cordata]
MLSGSLFLFDRKVLRYFRKDGHNWRKKKDGKTVKEAHERLKAGSIDVLHCYYAHGEENEKFQRRSYWMLEEDYMHIVLVHYREVQGNKAFFGRTRDTEEVIPSPQTGSPVSSGVFANYNQVYSQTTDTTSLNSAQASEYEDAESDNHQASSTYHSYLESQQPEDRPVTSLMGSGLLSPYFLSCSSNQYGSQGKQPAVPGSNFASFDQVNGGRDTNDAGFGLDFEPQKQLDLTSWENVLEGLTSEPFKPSFSSTQPGTMGIISKQDNVMLGQRFTDELNIKQEVMDRSRGQEKWQVTSDDSLNISKWPMDQKLNINSTCDLSTRYHEQKAHDMDLHNALEPFWTHSEHQNGHLVQNDLQIQLSDAELGSLLKSSLEDSVSIGESINYSSTDKHTLLGNSRTDELKKTDSFTRWMSKELGEVEETNMKSSSATYWDTVESENAVDDSSLSPQVHLDPYLLSPSLSQDQLFSIIDFSPNWAYSDSETKVLITGKFLRSQQDVMKCKWSCMFGEVEVPVDVLADGVLRCHAPLHTAGRVPFYVTCSNRLACSEVREFEFRVCQIRDSDMTDLSSSSTNDMLLLIRLGKLLSLGSFNHPKSLSSSAGEKPNISGKITSLMKEDNDEWLQMLKLISEEFIPGQAKEELLQKILKEKLHEWLLSKVAENGKGPSVLDKDGQGVLHLTAALGYDWAISPTIAAGVNINFRDVNGWTALHWAASCGRERTVVALVSLGAAPGALTDPTPKYPSGRTPADLASGNGHKGIAGYLAETALTTHLSSLALKDTNNSDLPETSSVKAIQIASERVATPAYDGDVPDVSLKDSLTAVCNAAQAAARIHQVYRVQSFQKKQLIEYGNDKYGMSDERALSLISVKSHRPGQHDEPVHTAAIRIQNKFRGWKGRKEFLIIRQRIVKLQAHVRGHQVRKHYKKIIWSVGIVEKAILRWRRKGSGLRGFRPDALIEGSTERSEPSKEDDYDFLKKGRKQTEERLQRALARVKSMVQYPEARDQYRRLLTVVSEFQEAKVMQDRLLNSSEEAVDYGDDLIDLEALLDDDTFMPTAY